MLLTKEYNASVMGTVKNIIGNNRKRKIPESILDKILSIFDSSLSVCVCACVRACVNECVCVFVCVYVYSICSFTVHTGPIFTYINV